MNERILSSKPLGNKRKILALAGLALLSPAFAACGSSDQSSGSPSQIRSHQLPLARYQYDFSPPYMSNPNAASICLSQSAYQPSTTLNDSPATPYYDPVSKVLSVTPAQGDVLKLTGFDQTAKPLSPVDITSLHILDTYKCPHGPLAPVGQSQK